MSANSSKSSNDKLDNAESTKPAETKPKEDKPVTKPAAKTSPKPADKPAETKPKEDKPVTKPAAKTSPKPADKPAETKPKEDKPVTKPAAKTSPKPADKPAETKPKEDKPVTKPAAKTSPKPADKPAETKPKEDKPVTKPAAKTSPKPADKPAETKPKEDKPVTKPAAKTSPKPADKPEPELPEFEKSISDKLVAKFGDKVEVAFVKKDRVRINVDRSNIHDVAEFIRDALNYDHVESVTGVDLPQDKAIEVVYHIGSYTDTSLARQLLVLTTRAQREENPIPGNDSTKLPSLRDIFYSVEFHEREVFEMLGVFFEGHPDNRRLLLPEDWADLPPLRKDFAIKGR